jgi:DNA (cytosine-5)-methyltransferase 1
MNEILVCGLLENNDFEKNRRVYNTEGISPSLTTMSVGGTKPKIMEEKVFDGKIRIRKITPNECWRLMGFSDEDFNKAQKKNSNNQLYKQAGNSICVPVLESIFRQMLP